MTTKRVLIIGLEPTLVDFAAPELAGLPRLTPELVRSALRADQASLDALGYQAEVCLTDLGETAEAVVRDKLQQGAFACVVIGAGVRTLPRHFLLFEKLINVVHEHAPEARICFNTRPDDTAAAVQRWI
jgi:hypothetical protein